MKKIQIRASDIELSGFMPIGKDMIDEAKNPAYILMKGMELMEKMMDYMIEKAKDEDHLQRMMRAYQDWIEDSKYEDSMDKQSLRIIIAGDFRLIESEKEAIAMIIMHSKNHGISKESRNALIAEFYDAEIELKKEENDCSFSKYWEPEIAA